MLIRAMSFQRARSDEQRDQRRQTILDTAAIMLAEMPVADISLNELSRRVGLAKSNVLRYFETREAVLLELLDAQLQAWIADLDFSDIDPAHRAPAVAKSLADSLTERPVLCDLVSAQAAVLERNVSKDVVLRHKRKTIASVDVLSARLATCLLELSDEARYQLIASTLLMTAGAWPQGQPAEAVLSAYAEAPDVAAYRMDFRAFMTTVLTTTITGLLALHPAS